MKGAYEQFRGEIIVDFLVPPRCVEYTGPWEPDSMSPYLVESQREHPKSPYDPRPCIIFKGGSRAAFWTKKGHYFE